MRVYEERRELLVGTWWSILRPDETIGHVEVGRVVVHVLHNDRELGNVLQSRARTVLVLRDSENNVIATSCWSQVPFLAGTYTVFMYRSVPLCTLQFPVDF
jgi:hypothetical protein